MGAAMGPDFSDQCVCLFVCVFVCLCVCPVWSAGWWVGWVSKVDDTYTFGASGMPRSTTVLHLRKPPPPECKAESCFHQKLTIVVQMDKTRRSILTTVVNF